MGKKWNENHKKLQCKNTREIFIAVQEYVGDFDQIPKYVYRAISLNGYLSEARHEEWEQFVKELEGTEEVELEEIF